MLKVAFHTLGCKVNQYETEAMKEQFINEGFRVVGEEDVADVYVINTCTVTNLADRKSRQYIRRMKRISPESIVAVAGCYAQIKPEELKAMEEVNVVLGNGEKDKLIEYVMKAREEANSEGAKSCISHIIPYGCLTEYPEGGIVNSMENRTRAYIKIQEGCNKFCTYCIIPYARGMVRSRDPEMIVKEAESLVKKGFKELVLTGINTALYGMEQGFEFKRLDSEDEMIGIEVIIKRLNDMEGDFRIRLSSLEPTVVNKDYVVRLLNYPKLCHHLHLSIQSGSDKILKKMNRHYKQQDYLDIVGVLRDFDEDYGVTTDIIVGFPGEEDDDFKESLKVVRKAKFAGTHIFKYSKRDGTPASILTEQVKGEDKIRRSEELTKEAELVSEAFNRSLIDKVKTVLFEEEKDGLIIGYSDNYIRVYAKGNKSDLNEFRQVKFTEIYKDGLKGEIV